MDLEKIMKAEIKKPLLLVHGQNGREYVCQVLAKDKIIKSAENRKPYKFTSDEKVGLQTKILRGLSERPDLILENFKERNYQPHEYFSHSGITRYEITYEVSFAKILVKL